MPGKKVQLNLYIPEEVRDLLQKIAAKEMLKNPRKAMSAAKIATEIIIRYLGEKRGKDNGPEGGEE